MDSNFVLRFNRALNGEFIALFNYDQSKWSAHPLPKSYEQTDELIRLQSFWIKLQREAGSRQNLNLEIKKVEEAMKNVALAINKYLNFYDLIVVREDGRLIGLLGSKWDPKTPRTEPLNDIIIIPAFLNAV